jgi:hypothetical protein
MIGVISWQMLGRHATDMAFPGFKACVWTPPPELMYPYWAMCLSESPLDASYHPISTDWLAAFEGVLLLMVGWKAWANMSQGRTPDGRRITVRSKLFTTLVMDSVSYFFMCVPTIPRVPRLTPRQNLRNIHPKLISLVHRRVPVPTRHLVGRRVARDHGIEAAHQYPRYAL